MNKKKQIILFVIQLIVLVCLAGGFYVYGKMKDMVRPVETDSSVISEEPETESTSSTESVSDSSTSVDRVMDGYTTIALVGIDARSDSDFDYSNSDTMIIASINNDTGKIKMVSIYRDTYMDIGDGNFKKANAAYCYGSAKQFLSMINRNLDLNVTDYVAVDFKAVAKLVDDVGGIEVTMTHDEAVHTNNYCVETSQVTGDAYTPLPEADGTYTLNGVQAVSYARIRYTAGNDMKRTQRQRLVIEKIIQKVKDNKIAGIAGIINDVFPLMRTSIDAGMMMKMAVQMIGGDYSIEGTSGFPFTYLTNSTKINEEYIVPVTLADNAVQLHSFLFNDSTYVPSSTVQTLSAQMEENSGFTSDYLEKAKKYSQIPAAGSEADNVT